MLPRLPFTKACLVLFRALNDATNQLATPNPGCMIVEIEEFEPPTKEDQKLEKTVSKVLLRPNSETLFADLCLLNQKAGNTWTDKDALEVEAKILVRIYSSSARGAHSLFAYSSLHHHLSAWTRTHVSERSRTVTTAFPFLAHHLRYDQRNAKKQKEPRRTRHLLTARPKLSGSWIQSQHEMLLHRMSRSSTYSFRCF